MNAAERRRMAEQAAGKDKTMTGRMRYGKYPHTITLPPEIEKMARRLMERERRSLSNLIEKCIEEKYKKLPVAERGEE